MSTFQAVITQASVPLSELEKSGENYVILDFGGSENRLCITKDTIAQVFQVFGQKGLDNGVTLDYGDISQSVLATLQAVNYEEHLIQRMALEATQMSPMEPLFDRVASALIVQQHHERTSDDFAQVTKMLRWRRVNNKGDRNSVLSDKYLEFVDRHIDVINAKIDYSRDFLLDYAGIQMLKKTYLKRGFYKNIVERPQHLIMRVACGIHCHEDNLERALLTYDYISQMYFTQATPTLHNAGTKLNQLASCFLDKVQDDMKDIGRALSDALEISKSGGGLGICVSALRGKGSYVAGTDGTASGLIKFAKVLEATAKYADQGGKRPGAFVNCCESWNSEFISHIELRRPHGLEEERTHTLFTQTMLNSLFIERARANQEWSFFHANETPDLVNLYGEEFDKRYCEYEAAGIAVSTINAYALLQKIVTVMFEAGMPYILFKDNINHTSAHSNIGTVCLSNLCAEIVQIANEKYTACCNLSSVAVPAFVEYDENGDPFVNHERMHQVVELMCHNNDQIIRHSNSPTKKTQASNRDVPSMGVGTQGIADLFAIFHLPYGSEEAMRLEREVMETIYHALITTSVEIAKKRGPYKYFEGSTWSQGLFQQDLQMMDESLYSGRYDWEALRQLVIIYGLAHSMFTALMPTVSTSIFLGNNDCFAPFTSMLYARDSISGTYYKFNKYLVNDLKKIGLWSQETIDYLILKNGSIQEIPFIPQYYKDIYRTAYELDVEVYLRSAQNRGYYVDQSQSMNLYVDGKHYGGSEASTDAVIQGIFQAHDIGLKTGCYYLRSRSVADKENYAVDTDTQQRLASPSRRGPVDGEDEGCIACSA